MLRATAACTSSTSQLPKVVRTRCALYILTWTCAPRHNGVHFFDISTSKSGPTLVCFVHFDLDMCFVPQRRALLVCFIHFDLEMCLAPQQRALFRHLNFQDGPNLVCFVHICFAPQQHAIFISHLASWLRTRRFSKPTFRPRPSAVKRQQWLVTNEFAAQQFHGFGSEIPVPKPWSTLIWRSG